MPLKRCTLKNIVTLAQFYDALTQQLALPPHFGRNLDALWDVLTTDLEGPAEVIWEHAAEAESALGKDYGKLVTLFREVESEREDFRFITK